MGFYQPRAVILFLHSLPFFEVINHAPPCAGAAVVFREKDIEFFGDVLM